MKKKFVFSKNWRRVVLLGPLKYVHKTPILKTPTKDSLNNFSL